MAAIPGHAVGTAVEIGAGYDPARPRETLGSDWTLVRLDRPLGARDRVLPTMPELPPVGAAVALGGYQRDHPLVLISDTDCRIVGRAADANGQALLRHNCAGLPGLSGAPLLIEMGNTWARRRSCGRRGARCLRRLRHGPRRSPRSGSRVRPPG